MQVGPDKVAIYALSFGTYALNQYLQLDGARVDVAVMDGPVVLRLHSMSE